MQLLRKVASFGTSLYELKDIYILYIRSLLEQSATVWHSSLTEENRTDLERIQKSALRIILGDKYQTYAKALEICELETLDLRRKNLCLSFAIKASKNQKFRHLFPRTEKSHKMDTRHAEQFEVQHASTARLQCSTIIFMQNLLNEHNKLKS